MFIYFFRSMILYLLLITVIRLLGKRQLGDMEPTEFVVTLLIADLASVPMQDPGIPAVAGCQRGHSARRVIQILRASPMVRIEPAAPKPGSGIGAVDHRLHGDLLGLGHF